MSPSFLASATASILSLSSTNKTSSYGFIYSEYIRTVIAAFLYSFFGFFLPTINSIKSIVSNDIESIKELLTFWIVLVFLVYIEYLILLFDYYKTYLLYPPELKIIIILWLTLPQTQGAYRIYILFLKPYFDVYEHDIDTKIDEITRDVKSKASRQVKAILWQLFLAPNDGILSMSMKTATSTILSVMNEDTNVDTLIFKYSSIFANFSTVSGISSSSSSSGSVSSSGNGGNDSIQAIPHSHLLSDFIKVLSTDCVYIDAGIARNDINTYAEDENNDDVKVHMSSYKMTIKRNQPYFLFMPVRQQLQHQHASASLAIIDMLSITSIDIEDSTIIVVSNIQTIVMTIPLSASTSSSSDDNIVDALLSGMRVLVMDYKGKCKKIIGKATACISKYNKGIAFQRLKCRVQPN